MQHIKEMPATHRNNRPKVNVLTSQRQRLLEHLRDGHSIHFLQAMQMDIPLLTDRIRELQRRGMAIQEKPVRIGRIACTEYSMRPSIHLQTLPADGYSWARLLVNDEWLIECTYTIVGSTRVCLLQPGDITLQCNWCAGDQPHHIMYLVNCALGYLRAGDVDLMPLCSREKPYYRDEAFQNRIKPYYRPHIVDIGQLMPAPATIQHTPSFTSQTLNT